MHTLEAGGGLVCTERPRVGAGVAGGVDLQVTGAMSRSAGASSIGVEYEQSSDVVDGVR